MWHAGNDFGHRSNWPYWTTDPVGTGKIDKGDIPYLLKPGTGIYLFFGHSSASTGKQRRFNVVYYYDVDTATQTWRNTLDQEICFRWKKNRATCTVGDGDVYFSNSPQVSATARWGVPVSYKATTLTKVSESDYNSIDYWAQRVCNWMGIQDTSTGWGRVVNVGIKAGLLMLFGSGRTVVFSNYETSFVNWDD
jgi:hypothetical protein